MLAKKAERDGLIATSFHLHHTHCMVCMGAHFSLGEVASSTSFVVKRRTLEQEPQNQAGQK
jgi:hypothetical protein